MTFGGVGCDARGVKKAISAVPLEPAASSVPPLRARPRPLHGLRNARLRTFRGDLGGVYDIAVLPDGTRAVMGGGFAALREVDLDTGRVTLRYAMGRDNSFHVAVSPDGARVVATTTKGGLYCFDAATGAPCWKAKAHPKACLVAVTADGRVLTGNAGNVRVWDLATGGLVAKFALRKASVARFGLRLSADGHVPMEWCNEIKLFDLATGKFVRTIASPPAPGQIDMAGAVSADGRCVAQLSATGALRVVDLASGVTTHIAWDVEAAHRAQAGSFAWFRALEALPGTGDGFVASSADGRLTVYRGGACAGVVEFDGNLDGPFALSPRGDRAVVVEHGLLHWLDMSALVPPRVALERHAGDIVREVALHPSGERVVTSSRDQHLRVWDLDTTAQVGAVPCPAFECNWVLHPDGRRVAVGGVRKTLWVLDLETGRQLHALGGHTGYIQRVAFSSDGERGFTLGSEGDVRVWSLRSGECLAVVPISRPNDYPTVAFHPHRDCLVTPRGDGFVTIPLDAAAAAADASRDVAGRCKQLLFARDGAWVCRVDGTAAGGGRVQLFDFESGRCLHRLDIAGADPEVVVLAPQAQWALLVAGAPRAITLWHPAEGRTATLAGDAHWVVAGSSADGRHVAVGTSEPRVSVWTTETATQLAAQPLERPLSFVTMSRAGHVVAVDVGGNVQGYDLPAL
jgi:WD40 repeat protein